MFIQLFAAKQVFRTKIIVCNELTLSIVLICIEASAEEVGHPCYAPLRTFVDINVIFLPFFFLLLTLGVPW